MKPSPIRVTFSDKQENYDNYDIIVSTADETLDGPVGVELTHIMAQEFTPLSQRTVTLSQLKDRMFVTTNPKTGSFKAFAQACARQGFTPKVFWNVYYKKEK